VAVVYSKSLSNSAASIKADFASDDTDTLSKIPFIETDTKIPAYAPTLSSLKFFQQPHHRPSRAASLLFTSGTSGRPKGVVHSYDAIISAAKVRARAWSLSNTDVLLNQKPGNWMGGFYCILPCLLVGARIEFCADVFNPEWLWNRVREGDVSIIDTISETWEKIALHFEEKINVLDVMERNSYVNAIRDVKWATVGGAPLALHVQQWWTSLRGKALTNQYGSTEVMPISQSSSHLDSMEEKVQVSVTLGVQI
jgi:long-subunit acyl-CoA synthetase (AMP-forming)